MSRTLMAMEALADQKVIAEMSLAGWRFVESDGPGGKVWSTYDPQGGYHGWNGSLVRAAWCAKAHMKKAEA